MHTESTSGGSRRDQITVETHCRVFDPFWNASTADVLPILKRYKAEYLALSAAAAMREVD
ncbi:hypothetical protein I6A60_31725 [Frankia sp. AgB1.9]|uniref:hypothetical protein n=1 Tax=unclassified Frankia TaxID=2632575 RepID=UPI0019328799|nr:MULTISPECIES: hypothetical protein [unclassified Frankia]MBL7493831.1 hypothetical protein [Frankia sp. AgW1.1]MBL7552398.1 hypothetical protein [Frankia sp. AgB1.9]MBL7619629.1 hypothetical protein [Frankia sp. AgB1.8]